MSYYQLSQASMRRDRRMLNHQQNVSDPAFMELYDEISSRWRERARKLQIRRWREIRHQEG